MIPFKLKSDLKMSCKHKVSFFCVVSIFFQQQTQLVGITSRMVLIYVWNMPNHENQWTFIDVFIPLTLSLTFSFCQICKHLNHRPTISKTLISIWPAKFQTEKEKNKRNITKCFCHFHRLVRFFLWFNLSFSKSIEQCARKVFQVFNWNFLLNDWIPAHAHTQRESYNILNVHVHCTVQCF